MIFRMQAKISNLKVFIITSIKIYDTEIKCLSKEKFGFSPKCTKKNILKEKKSTYWKKHSIFFEQKSNFFFQRHFIITYLYAIDHTFDYYCQVTLAFIGKILKENAKYFQYFKHSKFKGNNLII